MSCNGAGAKGSSQVVMSIGTTGNRMTTTDMTDKPFMIEKWRVYETYKAVKSSKGAAGVDGQTIEQFEASLKGNLYKSGTRCVLEPTFRHRSVLSPFQRRAEAKGFWVCPP